MSYFRRALAGAERVHGPDAPDTLAIRGNLAHASFSAGDFGRASPLHEQTLTDTRRVLGPDDYPSTARRSRTPRPAGPGPPGIGAREQGS
ncbi:tetratricopeptide repeat protein [Streptomyces sp. NPDC101490]|uniref:tetratricopeptide repeat protein n=1 Tax=Streptomyces sp. NPDC101490 TaxID=3366143 RepID=UPI0038086A86